jgi:hypothetical protein
MVFRYRREKLHRSVADHMAIGADDADIPKSFDTDATASIPGRDESGERRRQGEGER